MPLIGPNDAELRRLFWLIGGLVAGAFVIAFAAGLAAGRFL